MTLVYHHKSKHREGESFKQSIAQFKLNYLLCCDVFSPSSGKSLALTSFVCHVGPNSGRGKSVLTFGCISMKCGTYIK